MIASGPAYPQTVAKTSGVAVPREIPEPIKREVRQRCGFGCVMCGLPLYEYEHMLEFAIVKRHVADEITLLCDRHHREKTSGLLPIEAVVRANADPVNLRGGSSPPYPLHYSGGTYTVAIGGNQFTFSRNERGTAAAALTIDEAVMVGFDLVDDRMLLTLNVYDEGNDPVLQIRQNELVYSTSPWDISLVGHRLQVRAALGRFLTEIDFDVPSRVAVTRGHFLRNGVDVLVTPAYAIVVNNCIMFDGLKSQDHRGGIIIGDEASWGGFLRLGDVPRYRTYSEKDRKAARAWARAQLESDNSS